MLTTRDNKVDETEAQTYIKYIKKEVGMTKFIFDIRETVEKLNKSETRVAAYLQTRAGKMCYVSAKWSTLFDFQ